MGHTVNVMVLQAGVGRRVFGENAGYAREALASIESSGRSALAELDQLLRVLQPRRARGAHAAARADARRSRRAGRGDPGHRPAGGDARGRRDVAAELRAGDLPDRAGGADQRRPAHPDGRIRVRVSRDGDRVVVDVLNEGDRFDEPLPGRGLVNMRERAGSRGVRWRPGRWTAGSACGRSCRQTPR